MIDMKRTGQRIKKACDSQGITVKQIQRELNIGSFQSVYSWFQGKTLPAMDNYYALCKLLGVSMDSLIVEKSDYDEVMIPTYIEENNFQILVRLSEYVKKYTAIQNKSGLC